MKSCPKSGWLSLALAGAALAVPLGGCDAGLLEDPLQLGELETEMMGENGPGWNGPGWNGPGWNGPGWNGTGDANWMGSGWNGVTEALDAAVTSGELERWLSWYSESQDPRLGRRHTFAKLVSCALAAEDSLTVTIDLGLGGVPAPTTLTYRGGYAFAPAWRAQPLTVEQQEWVTACVLARTNLSGVSLQISMRGDGRYQPSLATTPAEKKTFLYEEGAFYGNLFLYPASARICSGKDNALQNLPGRVCATPMEVSDGPTWRSECGYELDGDCPQACFTRKRDGWYNLCGNAGATRAITTWLPESPLDAY